MKRFFQSAWTGAIAILIIGGVIGGSLMGLYVHYRLTEIIEPAVAANDVLNKITADDVMIETLHDKFQLKPEQLERVRNELKAELPLRSLVLLEALPILNRPKYVTFRLIEKELPTERLNDFLALVADSLTKKRPKILGNLYVKLLPTSEEYEQIEAIHSAELKKHELPLDDIEAATLLLIHRTKDSVLPVLTPQQQAIFNNYLIENPLP